MRIFSSFRKFIHLADEKQVGIYEMEKFLERMEDRIKCFFSGQSIESYIAYKEYLELVEEKKWREREERRMRREERAEKEEKHRKLCREVKEFNERWGF